MSKMSGKDSTFAIPQDSHGKILEYDGTTDCVQFLKDFDAFCQLHGLGSIVSRDNFAEPERPERAFYRVLHKTDHSKDREAITKYNHELSKFLDKCAATTQRWFKYALSDPLQTSMEASLPAEWDNPSRLSLERLRTDLIR